MKDFILSLMVLISPDLEPTAMYLYDEHDDCLAAIQTAIKADPRFENRLYCIRYTEDEII